MSHRRFMSPDCSPRAVDVSPNSWQASALVIVRILRLSRVSRLAKVSRHSSKLQDMLSCIAATQSDLVLFFLITAVCMVLFGTAIFYAEKDEADTDFISIPGACGNAPLRNHAAGLPRSLNESCGARVCVRVASAPFLRSQ